MFGLFDKILRTGVVTERYPERPPALPPGSRGGLRFDGARCDGCAACVPVCPSGAIAVSPAGAVPSPGGGLFTLAGDACHVCGRCVEVCPRGALDATPDFERATPDRSALTLAAPIGAGATEAAAGAAPAGAAAGGLFGRSLHVRHLDAGSCNGCDFEIMALLNPVYDAQRLGIDFVASPRHADVALVTGPVTRHLEEAVRLTVAAMPEPRLVVAVGACACGGGLHRATYAAAGGADRVVPVDVYVPGCPPRPEAILHGLLKAMGRA